MLNIDELTIGQLKQIQALSLGLTQVNSSHPAIGKYVVVRTYAAGVHAGILVAVGERDLELSNSRRIWSWTGALSCSEISQNGITGGKVAIEVPTQFLNQWEEILPASKVAQECLQKI